MSHWQIDYHYALQLRMLGLAVVFGLVLPGLYALAVLARGMIRKLAPRVRTGGYRSRSMHRGGPAVG